MMPKIKRFLWWTSEYVEMQGQRILVTGGVYSPEYRARKVPPSLPPIRRPVEDE